jgi:hypothetical protein
MPIGKTVGRYAEHDRPFDGDGSPDHKLHRPTDIARWAACDAFAVHLPVYVELDWSAEVLEPIDAVKQRAAERALWPAL